MTATTASFSSGFAGLLGSSTSSSSDLVPDVFDVAVNGRTFRIDTLQEGQFRHRRESNPALRQQSDTSVVPGESSISRDDLWRATQTDFSHGAGQTFFDREDSDPAMFASSRRVDVWDRWQVKLLNGTFRVRGSTATNLRLTQAGDFTYLSEGQEVKHFTSGVAEAWTTVTGNPSATCEWITTDGYAVFAAYGSSGIFRTLRGTSSMTLINTLPATLVGHVKGRLMAAFGSSIFNITDFASTDPPAALLAHANTDFAWVGFAEGPSNIYAAGHSGGRSLIYRIGLTSDGTSLSAPVVAGELPTGEQVCTIRGYLGFLLIGTSLGVRVASLDSAGNLVLGGLIRTPMPVRNFQPFDRFVWFGWSAIDATTTGLGRLDLSVFTQPLLPAYACDLEATATTGEVLSVATFRDGRRIFSVSGKGVWIENSAPSVIGGELTSSRFTFGIADDKVARFIDLRTEPLAGSVSISIVTPTETRELALFDSEGSTRPGAPLNAQQVRGEWFALRMYLRPHSGFPYGDPIVTRTTLRAYPAPTRSFTITVPLLLTDEGETRAGDPTFADPASDRQFLEALVRSGQLITYQEDGQTFTVMCDDAVWLPHHDPDADSDRRRSRVGTFVLQLRETSD